MRILHCRPWLFLKLLLLWLLSVFVAVSVLLYMRPMPVLPDQQRFVGRPMRKAEPLLELDINLFQKAQRLLNVDSPKRDKTKSAESNHPDRDKQSNRTLENLQFFPKLEQTRLINAAYVNRPELKSYLKSKFNLTDRNVKVGPLEPSMMTGVGYQRNPLSNLQLKHHNLNLVIDARDKCLVRNPYVLIYVHSAIGNKEQRDLIRQTWARITTYQGHVIRTIFVLAQPNPTVHKDSMKEVRTGVLQERQMYDDIIQGNFIDHYRNLTTKHLLALQWVLTHCHNAKYIVKVDDDTLVNVFRVVDFLTSDKNPLANTHDLIYCSAFINQGPRRDIKDKWYVSREEYPQDKYPTYCEGFAYVTTPAVLVKLYSASLNVPQYWIDDVYVTGMLAQAAKISHRQFRDPHGYNVMHSDTLESPSDLVQHALFVLSKYKLHSRSWRGLWKAALDQHSPEEYELNSRYRQQTYHLPHHTL